MANPWKILGIGCLVIVVLIAIVMGIGFYMAFKFGSGLARQVQAAQARVAELNAQFPFAADTGTLPDAERFETWLQVTRDAGAAMEQHGTDFEQRVESAAEEGMFQALGAMGGLGDLVAGIFGSLGDALQSRQMSLDEYEWYTATAHTALRMQGATTDTTLTEIARQVRQRQDADVSPPATPELSIAQIEAMQRILTDAAAQHPDLAERIAGAINLLGMLHQSHVGEMEAPAPPRPAELDAPPGSAPPSSPADAPLPAPAG